ncbi:MAG: methylated-DNA--[protein]-cysteine S-methyltransferase [Spirochaetales bacterium]|nr:methylated-DNA--[protein]-cysteine S-methyltransferase [Spirochaetales bacterium]
MKTKIGDLWLCVDNRERVHAIGFGRRERFADRIRYLPAHGCCDFLKKQLNEYFSKQRTHFDLKYIFDGTRFQKQVWLALQTIPYGQLISYSDLAKKINNPYSYRAVGSAVGANPVAIAVPCHRVIMNSGRIGGYSGGVDKKKFLLNLEGSLSNVKC